MIRKLGLLLSAMPGALCAQAAHDGGLYAATGDAHYVVRLLQAEDSLLGLRSPGSQNEEVGHLESATLRALFQRELDRQTVLLRSFSIDVGCVRVSVEDAWTAPVASPPAAYLPGPTCATIMVSLAPWTHLSTRLVPVIVTHEVGLGHHFSRRFARARDLPPLEHLIDEAWAQAAELIALDLGLIPDELRPLVEDHYRSLLGAARAELAEGNAGRAVEVALAVVALRTAYQRNSTSPITFVRHTLETLLESPRVALAGLLRERRSLERIR